MTPVCQTLRRKNIPHFYLLLILILFVFLHNCMFANKSLNTVWFRTVFRYSNYTKCDIFPLDWRANSLLRRHMMVLITRIVRAIYIFCVTQSSSCSHQRVDPFCVPAGQSSQRLPRLSGSSSSFIHLPFWKASFVSISSSACDYVLW